MNIQAIENQLLDDVYERLVTEHMSAPEAQFVVEEIETPLRAILEKVGDPDTRRCPLPQAPHDCLWIRDASAVYRWEEEIGRWVQWNTADDDEPRTLAPGDLVTPWWRRLERGP